ncbi:unnamed protein product [Scytosiphon promiscuus]
MREDEGLERGVLQEKQDGGRFSLGVTGKYIEQQCRTDLCALKYERNSDNLVTSVDIGFLIDPLPGTSRGVGGWPLELRGSRNGVLGGRMRGGRKA